MKDLFELTKRQFPGRPDLNASAVRRTARRARRTTRQIGYSKGQDDRRVAVLQPVPEPEPERPPVVSLEALLAHFARNR